jgi:type III secretion protein T
VSGPGSIEGAIAMLGLGTNFKEVLSMVALSSVRVYAAMLVLPATNDQLIQGVVRNGIALTIGLFVAFGQPPALVTDATPAALLFLTLKEVLIGTLIGFAMAIVFWTAEIVGMLIDNIAGFNSVQQNNPLTGAQSTPLGNLLGQLAVVGFYTLGGMMVFVGLLLDSHRWWPLSGAMPDWPYLAERFLSAQVTNLTDTALKIAGPVLVTLVLIDLGIGLLNKAAEKLEPSSLAQPIKGATAVAMVVLLVAVFFDQVRSELTLRPQAQRLERIGTATRDMPVRPAPAPTQGEAASESPGAQPSATSSASSAPSASAPLSPEPSPATPSQPSDPSR